MSREREHYRTDKPVIVVTGPTASGKTSTALLICQALDGEIVSADSMQIYRGMDIGTAKATPAEQHLVRHHLLDIREPGERYSVADYKIDATTAIQDIYNRGCWPVLCGGTGQYLSAIIEGLTFSAVPTDLELRERLNQEAQAKGIEVLIEKLRQLDPDSATRLAPGDQKRIVRALEINLQTGHTLAYQNEKSRQLEPDFCFEVYGLGHDRLLLYERINHRVLEMVSQGLEQEVRSLITRLSPDSNCLQAIGYKEMLPFLNGQVSREEAIANIQQATRRYAKRQMTWFRKLPGLTWLMNQTPEENAKIIQNNR